MANITINSVNIPVPVGGNFQLRYKKVSGGVWSSYLTVTAIPFTFVTADPINTNYDIEIYSDCSPGTSATSTFTTNFTCTCNISNVYNLIVGVCSPGKNTYPIDFDVDYTCMMNDIGAITSVFEVSIDGIVYYVNPDNISGSQHITINGLSSDGLLHNLQVACIAS